MLRGDLREPRGGYDSKRQPLCDFPDRPAGQPERLPTIRRLPRMGQCDLRFLPPGGLAATKMAFVDSAGDGTISLRGESAGDWPIFRSNSGRKMCLSPSVARGVNGYSPKDAITGEDAMKIKIALSVAAFLGGVSVVVAGGGWGSENRHRRGCAHLRPALLLPPPLLLSLLRLSVPVPGIRGASGGLLSPAGLCAGPGLHSSGNGRYRRRATTVLLSGAGGLGHAGSACPARSPDFCAMPATAPMPPAASPPPVPQPSGTN